MPVFKKRNEDGSNTTINIEGDVHGDLIIGDNVTVIKDSVVQRSTIQTGTGAVEPEPEPEHEPEPKHDPELELESEPEEPTYEWDSTSVDRKYDLYLNAVSSSGPPPKPRQRVVAKLRDIAHNCNDSSKDNIQRMLCVIRGNRALEGTYSDDEYDFDQEDYGPSA